jgi:hypothetical protein
LILANLLAAALRLTLRFAVTFLTAVLRVAVLRVAVLRVAVFVTGLITLFTALVRFLAVVVAFFAVVFLAPVLQRELPNVLPAFADLTTFKRLPARLQTGDTPVGVVDLRLVVFRLVVLRFVVATGTDTGIIKAIDSLSACLFFKKSRLILRAFAPNLGAGLIVVATAVVFLRAIVVNNCYDKYSKITIKSCLRNMMAFQHDYDTFDAYFCSFFFGYLQTL